jgi:hypothetical protein
MLCPLAKPKLCGELFGICGKHLVYRYCGGELLAYSGYGSLCAR